MGTMNDNADVELWAKDEATGEYKKVVKLANAKIVTDNNNKYSDESVMQLSKAITFSMTMEMDKRKLWRALAKITGGSATELRFKRKRRRRLAKIARKARKEKML